MCKELCKDGDTMTETVYKECEVEDLELDISLHVYFAGDIWRDVSNIDIFSH